MAQTHLPFPERLAAMTQEAAGRLWPRLRIPGLYFIAITILFCRQPGQFIFPRLAVEDATQVLNYYFPQSHPILQWYNGYIAVLPDILGFVIVKFAPLPLVPAACAWVSLFLAAGGILAIALYALECLKLSFSQATILLVALSASMPTMIWVDAILFYSLWNMLLLLLFASQLPFPRRLWTGALRLFGEALLIFSNPLAIVMGPWWALRLWRETKRSKNWLPYMFRLAFLCAYIWFFTNAARTVSAAQTFSTMAISPHHPLTPSSAESWKTLLDASQAAISLLLYLYFISLAGFAVFVKIITVFSYTFALVSALIALAVLTALYLKLPERFRRYYCFALYIAFSVNLIALYYRNRIEAFHASPVNETYYYYYYIDLLLFMTANMVAAFALENVHWRKIATSTVLCCVAVGVYFDYRPIVHGSVAETEEGRRVHRFLLDAEQKIRAGKPGPFIFMRSQNQSQNTDIVLAPPPR